MDDMCYVAEDPDQPGAAWGCCVEAKPGEDAWRKEVAKTIADWVRRGAIVKRVTRHESAEMLLKWKRPEKKAPEQPSLI